MERICAYHVTNSVVFATILTSFPLQQHAHQTDREVFESVLEEALGSEDFSGHLSISDLDRYADFIITALHTAVDKAIPKSKSVQPESNPISNETLALIKEKRKLRRQYSQMKDAAVKNAYQSVAETS